MRNWYLSPSGRSSSSTDISNIVKISFFGTVSSYIGKNLICSWYQDAKAVKAAESLPIHWKTSKFYTTKDAAFESIRIQSIHFFYRIQSIRIRDAIQVLSTPYSSFYVWTRKRILYQKSPTARFRAVWGSAVLSSPNAGTQIGWTSEPKSQWIRHESGYFCSSVNLA